MYQIILYTILVEKYAFKATLQKDFYIYHLYLRNSENFSIYHQQLYNKIIEKQNDPKQP